MPGESIFIINKDCLAVQCAPRNDIHKISLYKTTSI